MLTWQPDLFQRYELLRQVVERASVEIPSRPIRIIDVGSGPERLTERALGPDYAVVRTDVGNFDDDEIVRIYPGAPLPFEDRAADIVIAMDVLEHVAEPLTPVLSRRVQARGRLASRGDMSDRKRGSCRGRAGTFEPDGRTLEQAGRLPRRTRGISGCRPERRSRPNWGRTAGTSLCWTTLRCLPGPART